MGMTVGVLSWQKMKYENYYNCPTERSPKNETSGGGSQEAFRFVFSGSQRVKGDKASEDRSE